MFEAFILAGGKSSRMGTEKAAATVGGTPMLHRVAKALEYAGASAVTVVSSRGPFGDFETVADVYRGKGALGGIHAALRSSRSETVFVAGCDFPFLSSEFIRLLVDLFNEGAADCVIPVQADGREQPLAAVYSRAACLPVCETILSDAESSVAVKALTDRVSVRLVLFEEYSFLRDSSRVLLNVNTREDLQTAEALLS